MAKNPELQGLQARQRMQMQAAAIEQAQAQQAAARAMMPPCSAWDGLMTGVNLVRVDQIGRDGGEVHVLVGLTQHSDEVEPAAVSMTSTLDVVRTCGELLGHRVDIKMKGGKAVMVTASKPAGKLDE